MAVAATGNSMRPPPAAVVLRDNQVLPANTGLIDKPRGQQAPSAVMALLEDLDRLPARGKSLASHDARHRSAVNLLGRTPISSRE